MKKEQLFLMMFLSFLLIIGINSMAIAQNDFPDKPVTLICPYSAGGTMDTASRRIQPYYEKHLGEPIKIEYRPGAGGVLGTTVCFNQDSDGYTIGGIPNPHLGFMLVLEEPSFTLDDFAFIGGLTSDPACIRVHKDSPYDTLTEFIEAAKNREEPFVIGVSSKYSDNYMGVKSIEEATGVKFRIVTFGGGNPARIALVGKKIDAVHTNVFSSLHIASDSKVLAVQSESNKNKDITDNAPTLDEALGKDLPSLGTRTGFYVNSDIKDEYPERYQVLVDKFKKAVEDPEFINKMKESGNLAQIDYLSPEKFRAAVQDTVDSIAKFKHLLEE